MCFVEATLLIAADRGAKGPACSLQFEVDFTLAGFNVVPIFGPVFRRKSGTIFHAYAKGRKEIQHFQRDGRGKELTSYITLLVPPT